MPTTQEKTVWYALTTLARVKDRLDITITDVDAKLTRMINGATDYIERECGKTGLENYPLDGHFAKKTYTNEIYSVNGRRQNRLVLNNAPVSALTSFQWRAGTPSNPQWTDFIIDQYELEETGTSGIIRVYGAMPSIYSNMLRATYTAGYALDWPNAGNFDGSHAMTHLLPADLTNLCENLVVRIFKRRMLDGKASEAIQGAQTNWRDQLDSFDRDVLAHYRRIAF
jgi:Phage gp6-like head-tail connector protein